MITSPSGQGVIIIGGKEPGIQANHSNLLFELTGKSIDTLKWRIMEPKLKHARVLHVSFLVPDELVKVKKPLEDRNESYEFNSDDSDENEESDSSLDESMDEKSESEDESESSDIFEDSESDESF